MDFNIGNSSPFCYDLHILFFFKKLNTFGSLESLKTHNPISLCCSNCWIIWKLIKDAKLVSQSFFSLWVGSWPDSHIIWLEKITLVYDIQSIFIILIFYALLFVFFVLIWINGRIEPIILSYAEISKSMNYR